MSVRTLTKGEQTRERILELAQASVLQKGFAGTSLDEIIAGAGITKSGFFYHFSDKNDLAKALLERYLDYEETLFSGLFKKADELSDDPLHSFLIFLKLFADVAADLEHGHPGCLVASYVYQDHLFNQDVRELNAEGMRIWRERFKARLEAIAERYPPKIEVDLETLADMVTGVVDGGIIISKCLREPAVLPRQVMHYRAFIKAIFLGA
ncbi:MAG: TetR/AcrR family transcriptional regulator [Hyphomonadaceae bacterium]|nr:TetR/AcrR family transcriptional regulator [Hyphomonadaceae bacterium]